MPILLRDSNYFPPEVVRCDRTSDLLNKTPITSTHPHAEPQHKPRGFSVSNNMLSTAQMRNAEKVRDTRSANYFHMLAGWLAGIVDSDVSEWWDWKSLSSTELKHQPH